MSGSNGLKRYNGVEQDDEGAYVYYDEHDAALRRAKAEVWREVAQKYALWIGDDSNYAADPQLDEYKRFEDYCDARAAQIEVEG